jgi:hypothetical protein
MNRTIKKGNYLFDLWNYQGLHQSHRFKSELSASIHDHLLDPYSDESLRLYHEINHHFIEAQYEPSFSKEQENFIFHRIIESSHEIKKQSLTLLKRNFESVLLKRKILPKECFQQSAFDFRSYKRFLFHDLCEKIHKHHSLLSLCYHFAGEYQEACAILNGQLVELESVTLEFVLFAEHHQGSFKHPTLFIQDPAIIETAMTIYKNNPEITPPQHAEWIMNFFDIAQKNSENIFLIELLKKIPSYSQHRKLKLPILENLDPNQALSFFKYIDHLLRTFESKKSHLLTLIDLYIQSLETNQIFFESECFYEIPIIIDLLMGIFNNCCIKQQKVIILDFFKDLIDQINHEGAQLLDFFYYEQDRASIDLSFIEKIYGSNHQSFSIKTIDLIIQTFRGLKTLAHKPNAKKQLHLLSLEGILATRRIALERFA